MYLYHFFIIFNSPYAFTYESEVFKLVNLPEFVCCQRSSFFNCLVNVAASQQRTHSDSWAADCETENSCLLTRKSASKRYAFKNSSRMFKKKQNKTNT